MRKCLLCGLVVLLVFLAGCVLFQGKEDPDVVLWLSPSIPQEWVDRQIQNVQMKFGSVTNAVGVAPQVNDWGKGRSFQGSESFLVTAAYNRRTGVFSAEWGYAPNPDYGHNAVQMSMNTQSTNFQAIAICIGKHPVCYEFSPDFSTLTMQWGARFEGRGNSCHRVTWNTIPREP